MCGCGMDCWPGPPARCDCAHQLVDRFHEFEAGLRDELMNLLRLEHIFGRRARQPVTVASASIPPGFRMRVISRMVWEAPSSRQCLIDDSEYAISKVLSGKFSCPPSIFANVRRSRR